jgi:hypothetical protein
VGAVFRGHHAAALAESTGRPAVMDSHPLPRAPFPIFLYTLQSSKNPNKYGVFESVRRSPVRSEESGEKNEGFREAERGREHQTENMEAASPDGV